MISQQQGHSFQIKGFRLSDATNAQVPARKVINRSNSVLWIRSRAMVHLRPIIAPKMLEVHSFERRISLQKPIRKNTPLNIEKNPYETDRSAYSISSTFSSNKLSYEGSFLKEVIRVKRREQSRSLSSIMRSSRYNPSEDIENSTFRCSKTVKSENDNKNFYGEHKLIQSVDIRNSTNDIDNTKNIQELKKSDDEVVYKKSHDSILRQSSNSFSERGIIHGGKANSKHPVALAPVKAKYSIAKMNKSSEKSSSSSYHLLDMKGPKDLFGQCSVNQIKSITGQHYSQLSSFGSIHSHRMEAENDTKYGTPFELVDKVILIKEEKAQGYQMRERAQSETDILRPKNNLLPQMSVEKSKFHSRRQSLHDANVHRSEGNYNSESPARIYERISKSSSLNSKVCPSQTLQNFSSGSRQEPFLTNLNILPTRISNQVKKKIESLKKKLTVFNPGSEKITNKLRSDSCDTLNNDRLQDELFSEEDFHENISDAEEEENLDDSTVTGQLVQRKPMVLSSVYEGRPRTVFFQYHRCCEKTRDTTRASYLVPEEEKLYDFKFKSIIIGCVVRTFTNAGFKRIEGNGYNWNAYWGAPCELIKEMNKYQKVNHFPGCWNLGRKDNLWRNLSKMKRAFPSEYTFIPNTYLLGSDYQRFLTAREGAENKSLWIMKPCASACGRGIRLVSKRTKVKKNLNFLVSEYISNPHLINGLKYDLRLYVLVCCYDPLKIYLHKEGLVRFATKAYTTNIKSVSERFVHLTNWSVNKTSTDFVKNTNTHKDDEGSKWSLSALRRRYEEMGINSEALWRKIRDIIIKTIISAEPYMLGSLNRTAEHRNNCYELYGFDVLIDANLKPWLMEVNVCPSLNSSSPLDKKIKTSVICDMMNLLGFVPYDKKKTEEEKKSNHQGSEGRKYQPKNINDINELSEQNCLELLSPEDWNILFETDEEWYRKGDFDRIFPERENVDIYSKFFEFPRFNNAIVWKWLKSNKNFLEKICPKVSSLSV